MTPIINPLVFMNSFSVSGRVSRFLVISLMLSLLVACAAAPIEPAVTEATEPPAASTGLTVAADMYSNRDYPGSIKGFENVITDQGASANDRRLAHLGKALVYLSNDEKWHSIENAKMSLLSAGQVAPGDNEEFNIETDLLMDAVSAVIGTESKYVVLLAKSGGSGAQVTELKQDLDVMTKERDELLAEQKSLNEALEKLKKLTLGN